MDSTRRLIPLRIVLAVLATAAVTGGVVLPTAEAAPARAASAQSDGGSVVPKLGVPLVEGTAAVGQQLIARHGDTDLEHSTYQWLADDVPIAGATDFSLRLTTAQAGKRISFRVTISGGLYQTTTATSLATPRVQSTGTPRVTVSHPYFDSMIVTPGTWPAGTSLTYQWQLNGFAIAGATKPTLVLPADAQGVLTTVLVTATRPGYETVSIVASAETPPVLMQRRLDSGIPSEFPTDQDPGSVHGSITALHTGTGLADARVRIYSAGNGLDNAPLKPLISLTTNASGEFSLDGLAPGLYCAWVDPPAGTGYESHLADCRTGSSGFQVFAGADTFFSDALATGGILKGTVTSSIGSPVNGAIVDVYKPSLGPVDQQTMLYVTRGVTNAKGQYTIKGTPGQYFVHIAGPTALSHRSIWWSWLWPQGTSMRSAALITTTAEGGTSVANATLQAYLPIGVPAVSGVPNVGSTLTASHVVNAGAVYSYQWFANGVAIPGATKKTLVVPASAEGKNILLRVIGVRSSFLTTTRTSALSLKVMRSSAPTVSGATSVGRTLSATHGLWTSGTAFTYQWFRNSTAISGATGTTYVLTPADRGARITIRVQGRKTGYATVTRPSAATVPIG